MVVAGAVNPDGTPVLWFPESAPGAFEARLAQIRSAVTAPAVPASAASSPASAVTAAVMAGDGDATPVAVPASAASSPASAVTAI